MTASRTRIWIVALLAAILATGAVHAAPVGPARSFTGCDRCRIY